MSLDAFQEIGCNANTIYWDLHALIHGAELSAREFGDDAVELQTLLRMVSEKAYQLQSCFTEIAELNLVVASSRPRGVKV